MRRALLALAMAVPPLASAETDVPRAGIVVVGPDAAAAGALQNALEPALVAAASGSFAVVPASELAMRLGVRTAPSESPRVGQLVEEGRRLFYEMKAAEAFDRFTRAAALSDGPPRDRLRANVYRAVVLQSAGEDSRAAEALVDVLRLDPFYEVTLEEFPPVIRDLLESLKRVTKTFTVRVTGVPPGAEAWLDGRPFAADRSIQAVAGKHELAVRAPGFRRIAIEVSVAGDSEVVAPPLAIAFATAQESALSSLAARRAVSDPRLPERLATLAKCDALLVVSLFGATPEALVSRGERSEGRGFASADAAAISGWAAGAVRRLRATAGGPLAGPQRTLSAGWVVLGWDRTVRGGEADPVSLAMGGTGLHASGLLSGERFAAGFDVTAATFAVSSVEARLPGDGRATGTGGGYLAGAARGGYGVVRRAPLDVWLWAGIDAERYGSPDPLASLELPLFVSWVAVAPRAGVEAQWRPVASIAGTAGVSSSAGGAYVEDPSGTSGVRPVTAASPAARLAVRWAATSRWRVDAGWSFERREVRFHGRTAAAFATPISDARLVEVRQTFALSAGRSF